MMGRVQSFDAIWDLYAMSKFCTITSLGESSLDENLLYAGTDDGHIQVTEDGGTTWRKTDELPGVAGQWFVNDIKADLHDKDTAYVCVDQHKNGDFKPYVFKTTDRGRTWTSISANLPEREIVWRLVQDHVKPGLLFVGTEMGVYFTVDGGGRWTKLAGGIPNIPVRDLVIQKRENDLVCATFGRGFYILDDYSALRRVDEAVLAKEAALFPVRKAWTYVQRRTLGGGKRASQGDAFFVADNPDFGATFTYHLEDEIRTRKKARRELEKEQAKKGEDTPYPGWEELRTEELESKPTVVLTVKDADGTIVRRLEGPVKAGFHRVTWDLRYPATHAIGPKKEGEEEEEGGNEPKGSLVPPGTYTVSIGTRIDGIFVNLGPSESFEVVPLRTRGLPGGTREEVVAFQREVADLHRSFQGAQQTIRETTARIDGIRRALRRSRLSPKVDTEVDELRKRLAAMKERMGGNARRRVLNDPGPVSIQRRLDVAHMGTNWSTYGPTPTHRMSLDLAKRDFAALKAELAKLVREELPRIEQRLEAAGVPWSPGRR